MRHNNKELICGWDEYWQYCNIVTGQILSSNKQYSQIICILRGGFYLGDYISRRLKIPISAMVVQSYNQNNQQENIQVGSLSYITPPKGKILLVDDLLDTGVTMKVIKGKLEEEWDVEVDTAVIWQKYHSQFKATYFYSLAPSDRWIVQPFERQ
ncbi:MAG: phosphoribosyltransferase family protein [Geminocystis sp.]|nr:phosphoribosyltransferase family protein [Geminocystis sp.]HIK37706.1 phosphoribosyltransferase [Geminocystis sp. M7585_C2015_104]MCS7147246.1 phosphoribosyltransferase family protein [Geminocystis sp.]MCX8078528.1 phosphoribosyltransferase family protein [Geminocystis sp.]MDW8116243.1 phosphoribosyltransferase family protein [Geminocystis sp.]